MIDVRPKLFDDVEDSIQGDLRDPLLAGLRPGSLSGRVLTSRKFLSISIR
jgi:hypothetical protein